MRLLGGLRVRGVGRFWTDCAYDGLGLLDGLRSRVNIILQLPFSFTTVINYIETLFVYLKK